MRYDGQGKVVKEINSVCRRDGEQVRIDKEKLYIKEKLLLLNPSIIYCLENFVKVCSLFLLSNQNLR